VAVIIIVIVVAVIVIVVAVIIIPIRGSALPFRRFSIIQFELILPDHQASRDGSLSSFALKCGSPDHRTEEKDCDNDLHLPK
jgi:hypothetical protein